MSAAVSAKLSASVGTRLAPTLSCSSASPTTRIVAPGIAVGFQVRAMLLVSFSYPAGPPPMKSTVTFRS